MKRPPWFALLVTCSCASSTPTYSTSLAPPESLSESATEPLEPPVTKLRLVPSREKAENVTRGFFLQLSTGNLGGALQILDSRAQLTMDGNGSPRPAAPALTDLYARLNRPTSGMGSEISSIPFFAPVQIVGVKQSLNTTLVDVFVPSPEEVHGTWTLALAHSEPGLPISFITLPATQ